MCDVDADVRIVNPTPLFVLWFYRLCAHRVSGCLGPPIEVRTPLRSRVLLVLQRSAVNDSASRRYLAMCIKNSRMS